MARVGDVLFSPRLMIQIGIGGPDYRGRPSHTTRHAGPHRVVRGVEVMSVDADRKLTS